MSIPPPMRPAARRLIPAGLSIWVAAFFLVACGARAPIRVGFVAQLTGVQAELGVQERNGAALALEEINAAGGVAGRPIELIIRDDLGTPDGARAADHELIDVGVVAIIGHATSGQTLAGLSVTDPARMLMLSPTTSTSELSGKDDYFFRLAFSLVDRAHALAQHIYHARAITQLAVIYDTDNTAYSRAYMDAFADMYQSLGGRLVAKVAFSSQAQPDFAPLVAQLRASDPGGLLIIASDIDTALIAQRTRLIGWPTPVFTTAWAQTETLITNGGQAVEGLEIEIISPMDNQLPGYLAFKANYQARFGQAPSFGAVLAYESAYVLATALQATGGEAEGLPQTLVGIHEFQGLTDAFSFDRYGDVVRPFYLGAIHNGAYVDVSELNPAQP